MFTVKPLPYAYNSLEPFIDEETMRIHHDGHYSAYVKNLNDILVPYPQFLEREATEILGSITQIPEDIRQKVINNGGGVINHEFFWDHLKPGQVSQPSGLIGQEINQFFGSFADFKEKFSLAAANIFGSGWAFLIKENSELKIITLPNQDSPLLGGKKAVLALDVWEHAYYLQYRNKRKDYIEAWWNIINWTQAEKNLESV